MSIPKCSGAIVGLMVDLRMRKRSELTEAAISGLHMPRHTGVLVAAAESARHFTANQENFDNSFLQDKYHT